MNELKQKIKKWMSIEGISPSNYKSYLFELLENEIITEEEYHELIKASIILAFLFKIFSNKSLTKIKIYGNI